MCLIIASYDFFFASPLNIMIRTEAPATDFGKKKKLKRGLPSVEKGLSALDAIGK